MTAAQRVLVTGAGGQLGSYLRPALLRAGYEVVGLGHGPGEGVDVVADIGDAGAVARAFGEAHPAIVIHGAAYTDVDGCEQDPERAERVNHIGSHTVAEAARRVGAWLLGVGTDFVFSGDASTPYAEDAPIGPISVYGASKLAGERAVLAASPHFAVARTSWVFGGAGKHFPRTVVAMLRDRGAMAVVDDEVSCPTFAGDLAEALVALLPHRPAGVLHLTNEGPVSRFAFARAIAGEAGFDPACVSPTTTAEFLEKYPLPARRPAYSALANRRAAALGVRLPPWEDAVARYVPRLAEEMQVNVKGTA
ncbi:MAG TPA: dTDP-4-dehydrorhamnose reductase [Thermomicrobiales bacterium]|nr:dTDP-4-dehydrorhamnose reductase [Thermomicrobiales bacterium]